MSLYNLAYHNKYLPQILWTTKLLNINFKVYSTPISKFSHNVYASFNAHPSNPPQNVVTSYSFFTVYKPSITYYFSIYANWEHHRPVIYTKQIPCRFYSLIGCSISRGLDGHGHFWTKLISFRIRVLYKNIQISELKYLEFYLIKWEFMTKNFLFKI